MEFVANLLTQLKELFADFQKQDSLARVILLPIFFSGFGAFAGGLIAFRFRKREEEYRRRKDRLDKAVKVSGLASGQCGSALAMKRQLINPAIEAYRTSRQRVLKELGTPTNQKNIFLDFTLMTFTPPAMSAKEVLDATAALGVGDARNLVQAIALFESSNNLETLCKSRNDWIEDFQKNSGQRSDYDKMLSFYAIPDGKGTIDQRYQHIIEGLLASVDNVIFHSFELYCRVALSLVEDVDKFKRKYKEEYNFPFSDFSEQVAKGLFPARTSYSDWLRPPVTYRKAFFETRNKYLERKRRAIRSNYSD
jgi:hypothetical protein